MFLVVSTDGTEIHRTAPTGCNCKAGLKGTRCYHQLAARMLLAGLEEAAMKRQTSGLCLLLSLLSRSGPSPRTTCTAKPRSPPSPSPPRKENPMSFPKIVRQSPVKNGTEWTLTVSTIQVGFRAYETSVFDDTPDKRLEGWLLGDRVIETTTAKASTREEAMDQHREALYAARTETPKAPTA